MVWWILFFFIISGCCCCAVILTLIILISIIITSIPSLTQRRFNFGILNSTKYLPKGISIPMLGDETSILDTLYSNLPKLQKRLYNDKNNEKLTTDPVLMDEIYLKTKFGPDLPLKLLTKSPDFYKTTETLEISIKKQKNIEKYDKFKYSELEDHSKDFFKCLLQNGFCIIDNDDLKWLGLYQNFMKKFFEFHEKGNLDQLIKLTEWGYVNQSSILTGGKGKEIIYSKKNLNSFVNNYTTEDNLIEETLLISDHLEKLGSKILGIISENIDDKKISFDEIINKGEESYLKLQKIYSTPGFRITKPQSDSSLLTIHTKSSFSSLMVLNHANLEWRKIEEEMDESDLIIYPGYIMSYLTGGVIKPLLFQGEMDFGKHMSFSAAFEINGTKDYRIKTKTGEYTIASIFEFIEARKHNEIIPIEWFEWIKDSFDTISTSRNLEQKNDV
eukprot:gene768-9018_t